MTKILLEVIASSVEDAIRIEQSKADRIELLVDLNNGGLTPPLQLVKDVCKNVSIPIRVMIRDIYKSTIYDDKIMQSHIEYVKKLDKETSVEGIVFGSIDKNKRINFKQLEDIIRVKGSLKLTFNRAFDEINPKFALEEFEKLKKHKVDTLLTSGISKSAFEGKDLIKQLVLKANKMEILPGKSINENNIKEILDYTNASSVHIGTAVQEKNGSISVKKIENLIKIINKK